MARIYKDGVVRNVNPKDAEKLKAEKGYKAADNKAIKKQLQGKKQKQASETKTSE